jgi:hypothetical protein
MTARATFRQDDVSRACKGVKAAGLPVARVVVVEGRIEVIVGDPESDIDAPAPNPLDRLHGEES